MSGVVSQADVILALVSVLLSGLLLALYHFSSNPESKEEE